MLPILVNPPSAKLSDILGKKKPPEQQQQQEQQNGYGKFTLTLKFFFMQQAQNLTWYTVIVLQLPREEAVTLVGSLLCYPNMFPDMPLHQPGHQTNEYQHKSTGKDIKVCYHIL